MPQPRPHEELDTPRYCHVHGDLVQDAPRLSDGAVPHLGAPCATALEPAGRDGGGENLWRCSSCAETGTIPCACGPPGTQARHGCRPCHRRFRVRILTRCRLPAGSSRLSNSRKIRRQGSPDGAVGAKHRQPQVTAAWHAHGSSSVQPQRIARTWSGDRTLDAARRHIGHDLGKTGEQGSAPRALTKSAWVDDDGTRRPANRPGCAVVCRKRSPCAGYT